MCADKVALGQEVIDWGLTPPDTCLILAVQLLFIELVNQPLIASHRLGYEDKPVLI